MSDDDMIRRGDAIASLEAAISAYHDDDTIYAADSIDDFPDALRTIPAVQVGVKPHGEIERAVWSAMIWAADNNPGFNGVPEYTDGGNSFAETECRRTAARIRSALTAQPSPDVEALVEVLRDAVDAWDLHNETGDMMQGHWVGDARAALASVQGGAA